MKERGGKEEKGRREGRMGKGERRNSCGASEDALSQILGEVSLCLSWEAHPDCSIPTGPKGSSVSSHPAFVPASESGLHAPEKSLEFTTYSWLQHGPSRYSVPGSGVGKKAPSRGQGLGASLHPVWCL